MARYKILCPPGQLPPENVEIVFSEYTAAKGDAQMGRTSVFTLKDLETMQNVRARGVVSRRREDLPDGEEVLVQEEKAYNVLPEPWYLKLLEVIEEEEEEVKVLPKMKVALGKQRGGMIKSLLKNEK